ncbi:MAG: TonB family protein [Acidobacteriaceae bacterium]
MLDSTQNWQTEEPVAGSWVGSAMLHLLLVGAIAAYVLLFANMHGNWGQESSGAIQATLVSSAPSLPLPNVQAPNDNVLATQNPSPAPAAPEKKAETAPPPDAIPISARQQKTAPKEQHNKPPLHPQTPPQQHRAAYGEAAPSSIPMNAQSASNKAVTVMSGDFGARFGWYVDVIKRTVAQNWYSQLADPQASMGHSVVVSFTVYRDGSVGHARIMQSSGVPSLDMSAIQAVQRVDSFGPLPGGYAGSSVSVAYTFTYDQTTRH